MLRVSRRTPQRTTILKATDPREAREDELRAIIAAALEGGVGTDDLVDAVLSAMTTGDYSLLPDFFDWAEFIAKLRDARSLLNDVAYNAGVSSFNELLRTALKGTPAQQAQATIVQGKIATTFTLIDANVVTWAEEYAARLVVEITDDIRQAINLLVTESVSGYYTPQALARAINRFIPLHSRYARAVVRLRERMFKQAIAEGRTTAAAAEFADWHAARYAAKLARVRSRVIARTEVMTASAQGKYIGWQHAADNGLLNVNWQKTWITAEDERVCPVCGPMNRVSVTGFNTAFPNGLLMPPAHPNCRCDAILEPEEVPAWALQ